MEIERWLATDDSCQQMLFTRGHVGRTDFLEACEAEVPFAKLIAKVRKRFARSRPLNGNIVCDTAVDVIDSPGRGAFPVTVLDAWLPLWSSQTHHEMHRDYNQATECSI